MHNTLLIAVTAGLGGMLGWGAADFFAKITIDKIGDLKSLIWAHSFGAIFFILIALGEVVLGRHLALPVGFSTWSSLAFFGVLQMVVYWLVYRGFGKGSLSVLNPVFASFPGIVAIISIVFLGEILNLALGLALLATFAGILLLNLDLKGLRKRSLKVTPGLPEVACAALLAAFWTLGWNHLVKGQDPLVYAMIMYIFMSLAALWAGLLTKVDIGNIENNLLKFLALIGAGETLAYLAISWGYSATTRTSVVAVISGAFSLPTLLLARLYLGERLNRVQALGAVATITGIVIIALS
jgi:drug/metabolite transporter (DMT)-like permease